MAKSKEYVLTKEGYDNLVKKLDHLINVERKEASEKIKQAREFGDLSENAEYDAAKDYQAHVESEIITIQAQLDNAVIIEEKDGEAPATVVAGCKVRFRDFSDGEYYEYTIVGTTEANILENKISNESPLAQALLGQKKGADVMVDMDGEKFRIKILNIS
ncbi:MAG: transcription elongation factor GreA [Clostridia bacterium]|nr:transcription elongation factor GreA [Clostridia bacterium]MDE7328956.1 transcription elongation factor GreA [Clostridia bacterium]